MRIGAILAGLLMLIPSGAFPGAVYTEVAGIALAIVLVGYEWSRGRAPLAAPLKVDSAP